MERNYRKHWNKMFTFYRLLSPSFQYPVFSHTLINKAALSVVAISQPRDFDSPWWKPYLANNSQSLFDYIYVYICSSIIWFDKEETNGISHCFLKACGTVDLKIVSTVLRRTVDYVLRLVHLIDGMVFSHKYLTRLVHYLMKTSCWPHNVTLSKWSRTFICIQKRNNTNLQPTTCTTLKKNRTMGFQVKFIENVKRSCTVIWYSFNVLNLFK